MTLTQTDLDARAAARYGGHDLAPRLRSDERGVIAQLLAHRSVRTFASEALDDDIVDTLIAAAQSASTSSNLQSWSVVVVRDTVHKDRVATLAGDQDFIRDAPLFLVFVADWARGVDIAADAGASSEGIEFLDSTFVGVIDAAIAAQNAIIAAESLGLGAVFVGAVRNHPRELSALLALPDGSFPVVGVAVGRPSVHDRSVVRPRLPQSVARHDEVYRRAESHEIVDYDRTVTEHNAGLGRSRGWTDAVVQRVESGSALHGRQALREVLKERGLPSR